MPDARRSSVTRWPASSRRPPADHHDTPGKCASAKPVVLDCPSNQGGSRRVRAYAAPNSGTAGVPSTQALRGWQRRALVRYLAAKPRDFLAVATPGAGKTTFALRIAGELLAERTVDQIIVVVPTEHLKIQWAAGRRPRRPVAGPQVQQLEPARPPATTTASSSPTPRWPATRPSTGCAPRTARRW